MSDLSSLAIYLAFVLIIVVALMVVTHLLGERHKARGTGIPYESGMLPTGSARLRFPVDFYLVAMFFVIFDVAAVFLFAWAVAARESGWAGYAAILVFMIESAAGLAYIWKKGAFDWGARRKREHLRKHGYSS
ncbi:MAG TPA: NADH-quinone oxidoreductase subunit A [Rectinemataceae bacterium]|nr:NADH-quinone oxidoreductase subunit A [Treponema sp.]HUW42052.1 NADH-quinone oxidoreductase subunit A [Rectinemataceae bacterium]